MITVYLYLKILHDGYLLNTIIRRKYGSVYSCDLDLALYPFDYQQCFMNLRLTSALKTFLVFNATSSRVINEANNLLLEYKVGEVWMEYSNSGMYSEARVLFPLTRRSGYAILNIYIPTLVLLLVSYLTLFFRPSNFDVRMMSALTVQLVIATLFSQVSSSLPKTSYFKMVDVWFLFCIGLTFLVIAFHAGIDFVINKEEEEIPGPRPGWVGHNIGNGTMKNQLKFNQRRLSFSAVTQVPKASAAVFTRITAASDLSD
ncbi:glycine receptor subunit alpha-2-like [Penaeus indicus]|uniref:glycine receptor subunit alpha-2-like n=1 Tax=Penaeus indicus TaxID=29960 RepID=UPI00300BFE73